MRVNSPFLDALSSLSFHERAAVTVWIDTVIEPASNVLSLETDLRELFEADGGPHLDADAFMGALVVSGLQVVAVDGRHLPMAQARFDQLAMPYARPDIRTRLTVVNARTDDRLAFAIHASAARQEREEVRA